MAQENNGISELTKHTVERNIIKGFDEPIEGVPYKIGQAIFDALTESPDHVAQIDSDTGRRTTFREMKDQSIRCALWLENQGLNSDDIIVICSNDQMDAYIPVFGTFYIDVIHNAWSEEISLHSVLSSMRLLRPKIIFACADAVSILKKAANLENMNVEIVVFGEHKECQSLNQILQQQSEEDVQEFVPRNRKNPSDIAAIFLSSGSTGYQKGVMFSSEALVKNTYPDAFSIKHKLCLIYSAIYWNNGFVLILMCIFNRATRIIPSVHDAEDTCKIVEKYKVERGFLYPVLLSELAKSDFAENYDLKSLEQLMSGGSKLSRHITENLQRRIPRLKIYQEYGMTEVGRSCIIQSRDRTHDESLGFLGSNISAKIVDPESGETLGPNEPGELRLKSPSMMLGYYRNPEATSRLIDNEGWLHSGDLCYYKENGEFFLIGRMKEMMKFRNYQVSPIEIEEILITHPAVLEVGVVPVPHEIDGDRPMAFVKKVPWKRVTAEELIELSAILGEMKKLWGGVVFLDRLPKTPTGKISRIELKQLAKNYA